MLHDAWPWIAGLAGALALFVVVWRVTAKRQARAKRAHLYPHW